jgi:hypothetical protein
MSIFWKKLNMLFAILKFTYTHSQNPHTPNNNNNNTNQQGVTNSKFTCPKNKCVPILMYTKQQ